MSTRLWAAIHRNARTVERRWFQIRLRRLLLKSTVGNATPTQELRTLIAARTVESHIQRVAVYEISLGVGLPRDGAAEPSVPPEPRAGER